MKTPRRTLWLIALMLWQSLWCLTPVAIEATVDQMAHIAVHQQEKGHHHHDDASLHLASDAAATAHFHTDDGFQPPCLDLDRPAQAPCGPGHTRPVSRSPQASTVFPEGLLRPPRAVA